MTACDKIQYKTIKVANEAAVGINKEYKWRMRAYKCHDCGYYHLTTIKPYQKKVQKEKHKVDYTVIKPIKSNKESGKTKFYQEKQMRLATYRPFEQFTENFKFKKMISPKTPKEVYDMLPEMKIELINGKIVWGGQPIKPDTEFEKAIAEVINRLMEHPSADIILFAAYLTACIKSYNNTTYDIR